VGGDLDRARSARVSAMEFYAPIDPELLRRERAKARELRASQWWKRRVADGVCYYCRRRVGVKALTMDHIVPLGRGGTSVRGNVAPSCKDCNTRKKSLLPLEWQDYLDRLARTDD
jgi:5-methylcytosine-specific restriction protein A